MNLFPKPSFINLLYYILIALLLCISCGKDTDTLLDAVILEEEVSVFTQDTKEATEDVTADEGDEEDVTSDEEDATSSEENTTAVEEDTTTEEDVAADEEDDTNSEEDVTANEENDPDPSEVEEETELESRTTVFPAINDAHTQSGSGFDEVVIRLQENIRRSYLMFDLAQINSIGGTIKSAYLELIISEDAGNGKIKVSKGESSNWTESSLSENSAPRPTLELGAVERIYRVGDKITINLDATKLELQLSTLVLEHKNGDDLAFASKENRTVLGPKLVVTYDAPVSSEQIVVNDEQVIEEVETVSPDEDETNTPPIAVLNASVLSGEVPLEVTFTGNRSTDDKAITSYEWNFDDGSTSNSENPRHTFTRAGSYQVTLIVSDIEGFNSTETVTITVSEPFNAPPIAVASANITTGMAPFQVNFTGSSSSDDQAIDRYLWKFKDGSESSLANPTHTFETPGVYLVDLVVYDAQGLSDTAQITITITSPIVPPDTSCNTDGGKANEIGLKSWCWGDIAIPSGSSSGRDTFSNGQLALSVECSANQVISAGDRLKFLLNPTSPVPSSWCNRNYNIRSEIRTMPWEVNHSSGTEEWIGWDYKWEDYSIDRSSTYIFYQAHSGVVGTQPLLSLQIRSHGFGQPAGGLWLANSSQIEPGGSQPLTSNYTNITPQEGQTMKFVLRVIWGGEGTGLYQLWVDGVLVVDVAEATVRPSNPVGGNSKFGIYYPSWNSASNVNASAVAGITKIETSMGALRMITRKPSDPNYGKNSYEEVAPR